MSYKVAASPVPGVDKFIKLADNFLTRALEGVGTAVGNRLVGQADAGPVPSPEGLLVDNYRRMNEAGRIKAVMQDPTLYDKLPEGTRNFPEDAPATKPVVPSVLPIDIKSLKYQKVPPVKQPPAEVPGVVEPKLRSVKTPLLLKTADLQTVTSEPVPGTEADTSEQAIGPALDKWRKQTSQPIKPQQQYKLRPNAAEKPGYGVDTAGGLSTTQTYRPTPVPRLQSADPIKEPKPNLVKDKLDKGVSAASSGIGSALSAGKDMLSSAGNKIQEYTGSPSEIAAGLDNAKNKLTAGAEERRKAEGAAITPFSGSRKTMESAMRSDKYKAPVAAPTSPNVKPTRQDTQTTARQNSMRQTNQELQRLDSTPVDKLEQEYKSKGFSPAAIANWKARRGQFEADKKQYLDTSVASRGDMPVPGMNQGAGAKQLLADQKNTQLASNANLIAQNQAKAQNSTGYHPSEFAGADVPMKSAPGINLSNTGVAMNQARKQMASGPAPEDPMLAARSNFKPVPTPVIDASLGLGDSPLVGGLPLDPARRKQFDASKVNAPTSLERSLASAGAISGNSVPADVGATATSGPAMMAGNKPTAAPVPMAGKPPAQTAATPVPGVKPLVARPGTAIDPTDEATPGRGAWDFAAGKSNPGAMQAGTPAPKPATPVAAAPAQPAQPAKPATPAPVPNLTGAPKTPKAPSI